MTKTSAGLARLKWRKRTGIIAVIGPLLVVVILLALLLYFR